MKKSTVFLGILAITMAATAAVGTTVWAANGKGMMNRRANAPKTQLTAAQSADLQAKEKAVQDALAAGNYNAYVSAVQALNASKPVMTSAQFQALVTQQAARKAKMDAVNAALVAGDYNAWVTAETAVNPNSPLLTKINAANFATYKQALDLRKQSDSLMQGLGLSGPGAGPRPGAMPGRGGMMGW